MDLLLDFGNSRLKWAVARSGRVLERGAELNATGLVRAVLGPGHSFDRVALASVRDTAAVEALLHKLREQGLPEPMIARTESHRGQLRNAYPEPSRMGVDRWLAMLGAWQRCRCALVLVDCGTAVTMDCVDSHGQHHGGLILPGSEMMVASLVDRAPGIRIRPEDPDYAFPAVDTGAAVKTAARMAPPALVDRVWSQFGEQLGEPPELLLTGGDAERILGALHQPATIYPDLVFEGLLEILGEAG